MIALAGTVTIIFGRHELVLLPDRAIYWPDQNALIVTDVHLGKDQAFRHAGFQIPVGANQKDLSRLAKLMEQTGASRLIILGDLVHAKQSHHEDLTAAVRAWRDKLDCESVLLVRGNHDKRAGALPVEWGIDELEEPHDISGLGFAHMPDVKCPHPILAGHIHPIIRLQDFDRSSVPIPCFVIEDDCRLILPSFGSLTGGHPVQPSPRRKFFVTSGRKVIPLRGL